MSSKAHLVEKYQINAQFLPDPAWFALLDTVVPETTPGPKGGRPRVPNEVILVGIYYVLKTGCQWNALPRSIASSATVHRRYQEWVKEGVFQRLWHLGLTQLQAEDRLDMEWMSIDGSMTKAPLGQEETGPNPTDRGKKGSQASSVGRSQGHTYSHYRNGSKYTRLQRN